MAMGGKSGVAFVSVLFLTVVVLMSVGVIVKRTTLGANFQVQGQHSVSAFYAAESGVADALSQLEVDKAWAPLTYQRPLPYSQSSYEIRFGPLQSINNLSGASPVDSFRGASTVPPFQALLVVRGFSGGRTRDLEVLVARGGLFPPGAALISQDRLNLFGNVTVTGVRSLGDNREQPAEVSVLNTDNSSNHATWDGNGQINVSGAVTSNSPNPGAIQPSIAAGNVSASRNNESKTPPRNLNLENRVNQALTQGFPGASLSGTSTTLTPGNYTLTSPPTYNGDLVLDGCNLYVSGDFRINGSIRGRGSVFVTGATEMQGSTTIAGRDDAGVALFSKGDVTLKGLNGSQFLQSFMASAGSDANGVSYSEHLSNFRNMTGHMLQTLRDGPAASSLLNPGQQRFGNSQAVQSTNAGEMSDFDSYYGALVADMPLDNYGGTGLPGNRTNPVRKLTQALETNPDSSDTQRFLLQKFRELRPLPTDVVDVFSQVNHPNASQGMLGTRPVSSGVGGVDLAQVGTQLDQIRGGSDHALFDTLNDVLNNTTLTPGWERNGFYQRALSNFREMDFDRPGMAYFQGVVYTEGNFEARDELRVVGGLYAVGANSQMTLRNGVFVTYVPELVAQAGQALGTLHVRQWLRR